MCAVAKITNPGLELRGVILLDDVTVADDRGFAADGGPLACAVEESDVDGGVGVKVVSLAGFGVGVEDQVDATSFLFNVSVRSVISRPRPSARFVAGTGSRREMA